MERFKQFIAYWWGDLLLTAFLTVYLVLLWTPKMWVPWLHMYLSGFHQ